MIYIYIIISWLAPEGYIIFTHGGANGEHVDYMMDEPFYNSAIPHTKIEKILRNLGMNIIFALHDYSENDTHISLIILAQKTIEPSK